MTKRTSSPPRSLGRAGTAGRASDIFPHATPGAVAVSSALRAIVALSLAAACGACGGKPPPVPTEPPVAEVSSDAGAELTVDAAPPAPKTLYERLGGKEGVSSVVDLFVKNLTVDPRVNKLFKKGAKDNLEHFKQVLADQICQAAGGGCADGGKSMKEAHKGMQITDSQFDAFVEDLKLALDEKGIAEAEKSELFAAIAPMKDDVVEKKTKKK